MSEYRNPLQEILSAVPGPRAGEPIHLYLTGDEDGPNIFGAIYDEEDEALECGRENDLSVWRVPFIPQLDGAVLLPLEGDSDG